MEAFAGNCIPTSADDARLGRPRRDRHLDHGQGSRQDSGYASPNDIEAIQRPRCQQRSVVRQPQGAFVRLTRMLQECGLRVTKLGRCPSMLMATSVVHPTSVHLAYAQVALPGIGKARENIISLASTSPFPTATTADRKWDVRSAKRLFPKVRSELVLFALCADEAKKQILSLRVPL